MRWAAINVPSMCFSAKHAAHLLCTLHSLCVVASVPTVLANAGTMLEHCAGTMLGWQFTTLHSLCLRVTPQKHACRQTGPAFAPLAPLTASRTQPQTQVRALEA